MSINLEIDGNLMQEAMRSSGAKSEQETVEEALRLFVKIKGQSAIKELRGKVQWEGDLHEMRKTRTFD